jgi:hypothetical protein
VKKKWCVGGALALCACAVAAEVCVPVGSTVTILGRVTLEGLQTFDGSTEKSYVLTVEPPLCVFDGRNTQEPNGKTLVSRVELVDSKPPTGVMLAVSGAIATKNEADYSMRPTSLSVTRTE